MAHDGEANVARLRAGSVVDGAFLHVQQPAQRSTCRLGHLVPPRTQARYAVDAGEPVARTRLLDGVRQALAVMKASNSEHR